MGSIGLPPPSHGFSKNASFRKTVKPCFFVTFNIGLSWKFHSNSSSHSKDMKNFSVNSNYFDHNLFWKKNTLKKPNFLGLNLTKYDQILYTFQNVSIKINFLMTQAIAYLLSWCLLFTPVTEQFNYWISYTQ